MSNYSTEGNGTEDIPGFSLTKAVEDVSQHGYTQMETLRGKENKLSSLQATLSEVEKKGAAAEQELRSTVREILILEASTEQLEQQTKVLQDRCAFISIENTELQAGITEEEDEHQKALAVFDTYRNKMEGHRVAVLHAASQTEARKVLEEKKALVKRLAQQRQELKEDLDCPNGNTVQMAKRETDALKEEISAMTKTTAEAKEQLEKELETQSQLKKDIEIQNKRCEAIVKRLRCQLSRAQDEHKQVFEDVGRLERELAELKRQLEASQESVVSGQAAI